jgi:hypothetical protein
MIKQVLLGVMLAGAAALAVANDAGSMSTTKGFKDLDVNADGRVSTTEARESMQLNENFRSADSNGDGYVSQTEFDAWTPSATTPATPSSPSDPATTPQSTTPSDPATTPQSTTPQSTTPSETEATTQ